jgi:hypothetical protein
MMFLGATLLNLTKVIVSPQDAGRIAVILYEAIHRPDAWQHRRSLR